MEVEKYEKHDEENFRTYIGVADVGVKCANGFMLVQLHKFRQTLLNLKEIIIRYIKTLQLVGSMLKLCVKS